MNKFLVVISILAMSCAQKHEAKYYLVSFNAKNKTGDEYWGSLYIKGDTLPNRSTWFCNPGWIDTSTLVIMSLSRLTEQEYKAILHGPRLDCDK